MLTATDFQYLVGLLILASSDEDVEVELGGMVMDAVAKKRRDIDITVTYKTSDGNISAFRGIEVKDHLRPLDITHIEQLCMKFTDMPSISHRAIVSASGYTKPAIMKALHYNVELFHLLPWENPSHRLKVDISSQFRFVEGWFQWEESPHIQFNQDQHLPAEIENKINPKLRVCDSKGSDLPDCKTLGEFANHLTIIAIRNLNQHLISTEIQPGWTGIKKFMVNIRNDVCFDLDGRLIPVERVWIAGIVQYIAVSPHHERKILIKHGESKPFVGCAITQMQNGNLIGVAITADSPFLSIVNIPLYDRLKEKIYQQRLQ